MLEPVPSSTPSLSAYLAECAAGCEQKHAILIRLLSWISQEADSPIACMHQASSICSQLGALKKTYRTLIAAASVHDSALCGFCIPRPSTDLHLETCGVGPLLRELTFLLHHPVDCAPALYEEEDPLISQILYGMDLVCSRLDLLIERTLELFNQNQSLSLVSDFYHSPIYSLA